MFPLKCDRTSLDQYYCSTPSLQVVSICRSICLVLSSTHLAIRLTAQLDILAGSIHEQVLLLVV